MESDMITITKLMASEGMWLTQANENLDPYERIFTDCIYLSRYDSADNWTEWTDEQKEEFESSLDDIVTE